MSKEELNKDLEWEYAAAIRYVQHASVISGGGGHKRDLLTVLEKK